MNYWCLTNLIKAQQHLKAHACTWPFITAASTALFMIAQTAKFLLWSEHSKATLILPVSTVAFSKQRNSSKKLPVGQFRIKKNKTEFCTRLDYVNSNHAMYILKKPYAKWTHFDCFFSWNVQVHTSNQKFYHYWEHFCVFFYYFLLRKREKVNIWVPKNQLNSD